MNLFRTYIKLPVVLAGLLLLMSTSCIREQYDGAEPDEGTGSQERVALQLYTVTEDFTDPQVRAAADETTVGQTPMVVVFRGSDESATFVEASEAKFDGTKSTVMLQESTAASMLLIIANVPNNKFFDGAQERDFNAAQVTTVLTGRTLGQAQALLNTIKLSSPRQTELPFAGPQYTLPMSTAVLLPSISSGVTIGQQGNEILLTRAVAKVTVETPSNIQSVFKLEAVGVVKAARNGALYRSSGSIADITNNNTDYLSATLSPLALAVNGSTATSPIYLYEAPKGQGTSLIIKGVYNSVPYYYKVPFFTQGAYIDIVRNKHYTFTISEIGPGFTTVEQAIAATDSNSNIQINIKVTDNYSHDIITNGEFYLGVSNSSLLVYTNTATDISDAVIVMTNALSSSGVTSKITPENLTIFPTSLTLAPSANTPGQTSISVTMPAHVTQGSITIEMGGMKKVITVTRMGLMSASGVQKLPYDDYVSCQVTNRGTGSWLSVSADGVVSTTVGFTAGSPGPLYLMASPTSSLRTGGIVYAVRKDEGRTKIVVSQGN